MGEHLAAVCSPAYLREAKAARRPLSTAADLRHHLLLVMHDPQGRWPWIAWPAWLEAMGVEDLTPAGTVSFDQYDQVINAAVHGQGIALGRMSITQVYRNEKRLVPLFGRRQCLERGYYLVFAKGADERPEVKRFREWLRREIAPEAAEAAAA